MIPFFVVLKVIISINKTLIFSRKDKIYIIEITFDGQIAQSVEQRTENPRVGGSIPSLTTFKPFDFVEGLFVYRLNQIESNIKFYGYYFNN